MAVSPFASPVDRAGRIALQVFCLGVLIFLVTPVVAIIPLSFNAGSFLSYPLAGWSLRWYRELANSPEWIGAMRNSLIIATATATLATPLGALAALGLMRLPPKSREPMLALLLSPLFVPVIVTAVGMYFLYAPLHLASSHLGLILAHTTLAAPFVILVVQASLQGVDSSLLRAGSSLGAPPVTVFLRVLLPLIAPGVAAAAVFAFMASFDETVITIFLAGPAQRTIPLQMFNGVRDQISPAITAAATLIIVVSVVLLGAAELLRRRGARINGLRS